MLFSLILNLVSCFGIHCNSIVDLYVNFIVSDSSEAVIVSDGSDGSGSSEAVIVSDDSDSRC